jgi:predicted enzyme related to lactoylglutathione lyase
MPAKIRHLAIVSDDCARIGQFYESVFGMKRSVPRKINEPRGPDQRAVTVGDGHLGLNINPRKPGRVAGLDHFGIEVEDLEAACGRIQEKWPKIRFLKRPPRSFAGVSTHDPAGNVFDLCQPGIENRVGVYADDGWKQERYVHHFMLRVLDPEAIAGFYLDLFDLKAQEKPAGDPNFYLSDGRITLVIAPWDITNYKGSGIERAGLDHVGFAVESLTKTKESIEALKQAQPASAARPVGVGSEGEARLNLLATCPYGQHRLSDPDCIFIDLLERPAN